MALEHIKRMYFVGIGGIGMSALARYFNACGLPVAGYDKTPSPLTDALIAEGMDIHFEDLGTEVPVDFRQTEGTLVVYTPAIPAGLKELHFFKEGHQVVKRSELLGMITRSSIGLGVAGTHGKTTTSAMLSYVLSTSSVSCSAFLGGIATNFQSNVVINTASKHTVIEADEYDRSFLRLSPFASIITAMDPDHLDIYGTEEAFHASFQEYADKHPENGWVIQQHALTLKPGKAKLLTYGVNISEADYCGQNLRVENGHFVVDVTTPKGVLLAMELGLPGEHNCENSLAVIAMCQQLGLSEAEIRFGLSTFKGVKRRFEYHVKTENLVYIDDYAHHPTEIAALVNAVRQLYPTKKITGIFQPHLFSRTRDFMEGFAEELSRLDETILMPIYPAREEPMEGITSDLLASKLTNKNRIALPQEVIDWSKEVNDGVILTIGAGDIDRIVPKLAEILTNTSKKEN